jgi:hypothetical protein
MRIVLITLLILILALPAVSQNFRDPEQLRKAMPPRQLKFGHVVPVFAVSLIPTALIQLERINSPSREANIIFGVCIGFNLFWAGVSIKTLKPRKL